MGAENSSSQRKLDFTYYSVDDFLKYRDIREKLINYRNKTDLLDFIFLESMPRVKEAAANTVYHYEDDDLFASAVTTAISGGAAPGASGTFTIAPIGLAGDYIIPFRVGETVDIGNVTIGFTEALVTAVTINAGTGAHVYTIVPVNNTVTLTAPAFLAVGRTVVVNNAAFADGTAPMKSALTKLKKYSFDMQIFKEAFERYGSESANREVIESDGKYYAFYRGISAAIERLDSKISFAYLKGAKAVGLFDPNHPDYPSTAPIYKFNGIDKEISTNGGITYPYTTSFAYTDFQAIDKALDLVYAPSEYQMLAGINVQHNIDDALFGKAQNSGTAFATFNGDQDLALATHFRSVYVGSRTFHIKKVKAMNWPNVTALQNFPNQAYLIPSEIYTGKSKAGDTYATTEPQDVVCLRYKNNQYDGSRMFKEIVRTPENNGGFDKTYHEYIAELTLQISLVRKFLRVIKS